MTGPEGGPAGEGDGEGGSGEGGAEGDGGEGGSKGDGGEGGGGGDDFGTTSYLFTNFQALYQVEAVISRVESSKTSAG